MAFKIPNYGLKANFSADATNVGALIPINFIDETLGATDWYWDFGDGTTSFAQNPVKAYDEDGQYTVTLVAWKDDIIAGVEAKLDFITIETVDFNPTQIPSLKYYWKSDTGINLSGNNTVIGWVDIQEGVELITWGSGTQPEFIPEDPDFDDKPSILFNGISDVLGAVETSLDWPNGISIAAIYAPDKTGVGDWQMVAGDAIGNGELMLVSAAPGEADTLGAYVFEKGSDGFKSTGLSYNDGELIYHSAVWNKAESRFLQYVNSGTPVYNETGFSSGLSRNAIQLTVGAYGFVSSGNPELFYPGRIMEFMVFDQPITAAQNALLNAYTIKTYGGILPETSAFITAAEITDETQIDAVNNLVIDLKTNELWDHLDAIYPFVGGTATAHKYNLKDPRDLDAAFRLEYRGATAFEHNANGMTSGNNFACTFCAPGTGTFDKSFGLYLTNIASTGWDGYYPNGLVGAFGSEMEASVGNTTRYVAEGLNNLSAVFIEGVLGQWTGSVNATDLAYVFNNQTTLITKTGGINDIPNIPFYLNALNVGNDSNGDAGFGAAAKTYAFAFLGKALTPQQSQTLSTIIENYQVALGRSAL